MWYIVNGFQYQVWILLLTCVPLYIITMGLIDYWYRGFADWENISGFIIRGALSEQNGKFPNQERVCQKLLNIIWIWSMLVLVQAYAGNLTAMLARPKLPPPIRTLEELVSQDETKWILQKGSEEDHEYCLH